MLEGKLLYLHVGYTFQNSGKLLSLKSLFSLLSLRLLFILKQLTAHLSIIMGPIYWFLAKGVMARPYGLILNCAKNSFKGFEISFIGIYLMISKFFDL